MKASFLTQIGIILVMFVLISTIHIWVDNTFFAKKTEIPITNPIEEEIEKAISSPTKKYTSTSTVSPTKKDTSTSTVSSTKKDTSSPTKKVTFSPTVTSSPTGIVKIGKIPPKKSQDDDCSEGIAEYSNDIDSLSPVDDWEPKAEEVEMSQELVDLYTSPNNWIEETYKNKTVKNVYDAMTNKTLKKETFHRLDPQIKEPFNQLAEITPENYLPWIKDSSVLNGKELGDGIYPNSPNVKRGFRLWD